MTVHEHLLNVAGKWKACEKARKWAAQYSTAQEVWDNCTNIHWLFWWASRLGQHKKVVEVAREIANSVKHFKNRFADYAAADAADYAADAVADYAVAAAAAAAAAVAADYAADAVADYAAAAVAAAYAADAAVADADYAAADYAATYAYVAAYKKQKELDLSIARKHLVCPWHEEEAAK